MMSHLKSETGPIRGDGSYIFKEVMSNWLRHPEEIVFKIESKIKIFSDEQQMGPYIISNPAL